MQDLIQSIEAVLRGLRDPAVWLGPDPFDDEGLLLFLDAAMRMARLHRARLSMIEVDLGQHGGFADEYWHIPVSASLQAGVIRLTFDPLDDAPVHTAL
jgi:hypothetical protein